MAAGFAALVLSSGAAFAGCTLNVPGGQVIAMAGDTCLVSGSYATTENGQIAGQATGLNALITGPSSGTVSFSTTGTAANALQADTGGAVTLSGGSVTTSGNGSAGLFATGIGSQINATDVAVSAAGGGLLPYTTNAILAGPGAVVTITGGSASTTGTDAYVAGAFTTGGTGVATLNLSGTTITATGAGSGGLAVNGTGATITGTGLTITTHGNYDSVNNFSGAGATNQSYSGSPGGGVLTLTNSSILTTGTIAQGVNTANGGITTLTDDTITTSSFEATALSTVSSGQTTMTGGSLNTTGNGSYAVSAEGGGVTKLVGTTIGTTGNGSGGIAVHGTGS
jgi:hypothetical protein